MAQTTVTHYIDDMTGDPAHETISFGLDGKSYEIDLTEENADALREVFAPFVDGARRVVVNRKSSKPRAAATNGVARPDKEQNQAIRDWASRNGHKVADRGRISRTVRDAFAEAH